MSLNRHEQAVFDYIDGHPEEKRHWRDKIVAATRGLDEPGSVARTLERELWDYLVERSAHVASIRVLGISPAARLSLLNLAEYLLRLWGPMPRPKKKSSAPL